MAESTIITGQFVRISQTPASIGERLLALVIDYFLIVIYVYSTATLLTELRLPSGFTLIFFLCVIYLPILGYSFLCETFNHGQSFGKRIMNIRVVKADGTTPSISSYLLRWLLFPIDGPITGGLGILVVLLTKNSQRMGDLAAGTMVIKEKNYRKIHVSLDEFDYLTKDYHPVYPQSADLSLEQVNVITRTLQSSEKDRPRRILLLAQKVQELLSITPRDNNQEKFLQTGFGIISIMHWKRYKDYFIYCPFPLYQRSVAMRSLSFPHLGTLVSTVRNFKFPTQKEAVSK